MKWNDHIDYLCKNVAKYLSQLRKLKYTLSRKNLEKIYIVYIRPLFEYACELWDNCGNQNAEKLEKLQLSAARVITGLPIYTKKDFIYTELGWEMLSTRRHIRKLSLFYKVKNNNVPEYLTNLLPNTVASSTSYNLRNQNNLRIDNYRLTQTSNSFFPSSSRSWNQLEDETRQAPSLNTFKTMITSTSNLNPFFTYGRRKENILHCRLRNRSSELKYDLFKANLINYKSCQCGHPCEDSYHYFIKCPIYNTCRQELKHNLENNNFTLKILIEGDSTLSKEENEKICLSTQKFIKCTKRFG